MYVIRRLVAALAVTMLVMAFAAFTGPVGFYNSTCTGVGTPVSSTGGGGGVETGSTTYVLECIGSCTAGSCSKQEATNANRDTYQYCGCGPNSEPACCHLVYNKTLRRFESRGDCPSCPASGGCRVDSGGTSVTAQCTAVN